MTHSQAGSIVRRVLTACSRPLTMSGPCWSVPLKLCLLLICLIGCIIGAETKNGNDKSPPAPAVNPADAPARQE